VRPIDDVANDVADDVAFVSLVARRLGCFRRIKLSLYMAQNTDYHYIWSNKLLFRLHMLSAKTNKSSPTSTCVRVGVGVNSAVGDEGYSTILIALAHFLSEISVEARPAVCMSHITSITTIYVPS